jgi:hypothetical protein
VRLSLSVILPWEGQEGRLMRDGRSAYQCVFAGNSEAVR